MDIEQRLRESLAAREPGAEFEDAVMARLSQARSAAAAAPRRRPVLRWAGAMAATVFATAFGLHWFAEHQRAEYNREQLVLALAITSHELGEVQRKLTHVDEAGEQENGT